MAEIAETVEGASPLQVVRSLLFDGVFYVGTFIASFLLIWTMLLPRRQMLWWLRGYFQALAWAESLILGLRYRVLGREHLPKGAFILAAKHQSVWETLKMHLLLDDPAVVLKQELLSIPIWGWYAARAEMVSVHRGAGGSAIASLVKGGRHAADQGRPIVIFPQGTRVLPGRHRPYKVGVAALYEELGLPVVPMALNSGVFWPRGAKVKKGGLVTAEFLQPIEPGLDRQAFLRRLENELETASDRLVLGAGGPPTRKDEPSGAGADG